MRKDKLLKKYKEWRKILHKVRPNNQVMAGGGNMDKCSKIKKMEEKKRKANGVLKILH